MSKKLFMGILGGMTILLFFCAGEINAQDDFALDGLDFDSPGSGTAEAPASDGGAAAGAGLIGNNSSLSESEQIDLLARNFKFEPPEKKDPFKPIVKERPLPPVSRPSVTAARASPPPPPPPKPIQLFVSGIVGNDQERLAIVKFENELRTIARDDVVKGQFKVVDILPDRVVIYSNREQMRRTFPLGGGKD